MRVVEFVVMTDITDSALQELLRAAILDMMMAQVSYYS